MILSHVVRALRAWWRYRTCVQQLSGFSDLELADIGLSRSDIVRVARGAGRDNDTYVAAMSRLPERRG